MLCDRNSRVADARSPPVASNAIDVTSTSTRLCSGQDRDYSDPIPMSAMTGHSSSPPVIENHSSSSPISHASSNKPKLSFSISRLLGDDSTEPQESDNKDNNNSQSSTDNSCSSARTTPASPVMVSCPAVITSQSYFSPAELKASSVPVMAQHYDPLQSGANGTVIRVPAHRPAHLSYPAAVSFPWVGSQGIVKDRIPGKSCFFFSNFKFL